MSLLNVHDGGGVVRQKARSAVPCRERCIVEFSGWQEYWRGHMPACAYPTSKMPVEWPQRSAAESRKEHYNMASQSTDNKWFFRFFRSRSRSPNAAMSRWMKISPPIFEAFFVGLFEFRGLRKGRKKEGGASCRMLKKGQEGKHVYPHRLCLALLCFAFFGCFACIACIACLRWRSLWHEIMYLRPSHSQVWVDGWVVVGDVTHTLAPRRAMTPKKLVQVKSPTSRAWSCLLQQLFHVKFFRVH